MGQATGAIFPGDVKQSAACHVTVDMEDPAPSTSTLLRAPTREAGGISMSIRRTYLWKKRKRA